MSGVAKMRAMFENREGTSPPDRGRSPAGSAGGASIGGTSPRPLSKVRTSFVTVERSGQLGLGLRRDTSGEPSMTKRRTSFSIDEETQPQVAAERKQSLATEMSARKQSTMIDETIPEFAILTPAATPLVEAKNPMDAVNGKEWKEKKLAKAEEKKATNGQTSNGHTNGTSKPTTSKTLEKPAATKTATKPSPISTAKTSTSAKPSPKKSPVPKTPTTPNKPKTRDASTNTPEKRDSKGDKKELKGSLPSTNRTAKPASRPPTTAAHGSAPKTRIPASPPQTGFHKPRPKSPTKPVKLPASLTAHTASSGSKTAAASAAAAPPRQSLSRASGNIQPPGSTRSPSRATTSKTGLTRNASHLKSAPNRPSLGPPPNALKKQPSRQSLPQNAPPADEGFLARMMRPTTASASKTAEKPPVTPPKKAESLKKPTTKDGSIKIDLNKGSPVHKAHKDTTIKTIPKTIKPASEPVKAKETPKSEDNVAAAPQVAPKEVSDSVPEAKLENTEAVVEENIEEVKEEPKLTAEGPSIEKTKVEEPVVSEINDKLSVADHSEAVSESQSAVEDKADLVAESPKAVQETVVKSETINEEFAEPKSTEIEVAEPEPVVNEIVEEEAAPNVEVAIIEDTDVPADSEAVAEVQAAISEPEPKAVEAVVASAGSKPVVEEDPEDRKAREEIEALNAELAKAALEEDA